MAKKTTKKKSLLAKGGGNATAGGVTMQASVAATFAARMLNSTAVDSRLGLGAAKPSAIRCEAEIPVDDIAIETDASGWVFIQSKNTLTASFVLTSELGKTCDEIARVWLVTSKGKGDMGWNRPLIYGRDAILIAVGHATFATIKIELAAVLNAVRAGSTATLTKSEQDKLTAFRALMRSAFDTHSAPATIDIDSVIKFVHIFDYDFRGPHRELSEQTLAHILELPAEAPAAFKAIERHCQDIMTARSRLDEQSLRASLAADGILIKAGPKGLMDTQAEIKANTDEILRALTGRPKESLLVTKIADQRLTELRQIRFILGTEAATSARDLLTAADTGELAAASGKVRQSIYAWCARLVAATDHDYAKKALAKAEEFGPSEETLIASAFVELFAPNGEKTKALGILAPLDTAESKTASLIISVHGLTAADGLDWFKRSRIDLAELDPDGKFRILAMHFEVDDLEGALNVVTRLKDADYNDAPLLLYYAGHAHLEQAVHPDLRGAFVAPLPPDLADFPLGDDLEAMEHRAAAIEFYKKASVALGKVGAQQAAAVAEDRALWLQLRDPTYAQKALEELQTSMSNERVRLRRVPIAFAFNLEMNLHAVEEDIERATALSGGKSPEAAVARLEVALHRKAPEVADYIDKHREQLLSHYQPEFLIAIEAESLTKAGRTEEAREKLAILEASEFPTNSLMTLRTTLDGVADDDLAARRETEYRANPTITNLMSLVAELRRARNFPKLADFAEDLFTQIKDVASAETYCGALYEINADEEIALFAEEYPEIVKASTIVTATVAWAYYRLGRISDSKSLLDILRDGRDDESDRLLATNIAVTSGDWSSLSTFVEAEWQNRERRDASELLRAGALAQRIGATPRSQELVKEAANKANGDARILVAAYSTASSAGWENEESIHGWLETALKTSGEDGPIQRVDIRELIEGQSDWDDRLDRTWDLVLKAEAPLFVAAKIARRTLLDVFLRNGLRNLDQTDPRKRSPVFAFAGTKPIQSKVGKRIAIDLTSLLTFSITGTLGSFLSWADSVTIPHTTLGWLFEERDKLAFHQPSQVKRAREVKQLIDADKVHRFEGATANQELESRVGDDIARYLIASQTLDEQDKSQKLVIRPYPLPKPGSLLEENADVSGYEENFAGVADLLAALKLGGHLSEVESRNASAYLRLHEEPWPHNPVVQSAATLYLDDVALSYLQHLGLLARLPMAGFKVFVTSSEVERANELVGYDASADTARRIVEELQVTLRDSIASGKVKLGRLLPGDGKDDDFETHPSRLLLTDTLEVDALVIDDRSVNRFGIHQTYPIATSIDTLATMVADGSMGADELTQALTTIRRAGMLFVPIDQGEIGSLLNSAPVVAGQIQETAELRAVRESVLRARMTDALQLPNESVWLDRLLEEALGSLRSQWQTSVQDDVARARSNWLLQFLDIRGWAHRSATAEVTVAARQRAQILSLLIMPAADESSRQRYWAWLNESVLAQFKEEQPDSYEELLKSIREVIDERVADTLAGENHDGNS